MRHWITTCVLQCIRMQPFSNSSKLLTISCFHKYFMTISQTVQELWHDKHTHKQTLQKTTPSLLHSRCADANNSIFAVNSCYLVLVFDVCKSFWHSITIGYNSYILDFTMLQCNISTAAGWHRKVDKHRTLAAEMDWLRKLAEDRRRRTKTSYLN